MSCKKTFQGEFVMSDKYCGETKLQFLWLRMDNIKILKDNGLQHPNL